MFFMGTNHSLFRIISKHAFIRGFKLRNNTKKNYHGFLGYEM